MDKQRVARELVRLAEELVAGDDNAARTKQELRQGLQSYVVAFKQAKQYGNKQLAAQIKKNIEAIIREKDLDAKLVWAVG